MHKLALDKSKDEAGMLRFYVPAQLLMLIYHCQITDYTCDADWCM